MPQEKASSASASAQQELKDLREQAAAVGDRDIHLGQVLDAMIVHLARLSGVDLNKKEEKQ
jgi:hypothetical protein